MKLVLAVPVSFRGFARVAQMVFAVATALLSMYLLFGFVGLLVLVAELVWLGALLRKAAYGK